MDVLVHLGTTVAMLWSCWSPLASSVSFHPLWVKPSTSSLTGRPSSSHLFCWATFWKPTLNSRHRCRSQPHRLQPKEAWVVVDEGTVATPVEEIARGTLLKVRAGETVPLDGEVENSTGLLDESMMTGILPRSGTGRFGVGRYHRSRQHALCANHGARGRHHAGQRDPPRRRCADRESPHSATR